MAMLLPFLRQRREDRARAQRADRYAALLMVPPPDALVDQLADLTDRDPDHARWEWRYARRALGVIVAERVAHQLPDNPHNRRYLETKRDRTGHILS